MSGHGHDSNAGSTGNKPQPILEYGYGQVGVRHHLLRVEDPTKAGVWLQETGKEMSTASKEDWAVPHAVALTISGLSGVGVAEKVLCSFPEAFTEGAARRAKSLGDDLLPLEGFMNLTAESEDGGDVDQCVDVIVSVRLKEPGSGEIDWNSSGLKLLASIEALRDVADDAATPPGSFGTGGSASPMGFVIPFGYRDGVTDIVLIDGDKYRTAEGWPAHVTPRPRHEFVLCPKDGPDAWRAFADGGTYGAFRVMHQDVNKFDDFLARSADLLQEMISSRGANRLTRDYLEELVAASLMGRWRNTGLPYSVPGQDEKDLSREDLELGLDHSSAAFFPDYADDPDGHLCPVYSHIRRGNPRRAMTVQRGVNARHLIRRGLPYKCQELGSFAEEDSEATSQGLVGYFLCGSIERQFEGLLGNWLQAGLTHPETAGTADPILGANDRETRPLSIRLPGQGGEYEIPGPPRLVRTIGAAYAFLPAPAVLARLAEFVDS